MKNRMKKTVRIVGFAVFGLSLFGGMAVAVQGSQPGYVPPACEGRKFFRGEDVWYGHRRKTFTFRGHTAWIVEPSVPSAPGTPWTWTMQWADAYVPGTAVPDLLKRGFHHVTIDLYATRMDEQGLRDAAAFQDFLVRERGFAPKANLVGLSWGGFFSTRYAATYPQNVAKIYLDAPLLNFDGFGMEVGPWERRKPADGVWSSDPHMPVNLAAPIAKAGIPILLAYGGKDVTVPPPQNCELFIPRFKAAGGARRPPPSELRTPSARFRRARAFRRHRFLHPLRDGRSHEKLVTAAMAGKLCDATRFTTNPASHSATAGM